MSEKKRGSEVFVFGVKAVIEQPLQLSAENRMLRETKRTCFG